ncbi:MAG: carboxypeptidase-like regulatory domain-containing protein [Bacteroidota bacterium]
MKFHTLLTLLMGIVLCACQDNVDITNVETIEPGPTEIPTVELTLRGWVTEPFSLFSADLNYLRIHNATVQLMFAGEVLAETNTDNDGYYEFPSLKVPAEDAFLYITAPGYYPNVSVVDGASPDYFSRYLFRSSFGNFSGEGLTGAKRYVRITGYLQEPTDASGATFYLTNLENELVGNYTSDGDLRFELSTVADEQLLFYYEFRCLSGGPIPIGSLSENLDLGNLFDLSVDFLEDQVAAEINATDCNGEALASGYAMLTRKDQTVSWSNTEFYFAEQCLLEDDPNAFLTYISTEPRRYGTVNIDYTGGDVLDLSVEVCEADRTFIEYSIDGGATNDLQWFTFFNQLPDGRAILKQITPSDAAPSGLSFELASAEGQTSADVRAFTQRNIDFGGNSLSVDIQLNNGEIVEGTFSGPVYNAAEDLIGNMEGSFRAKIQ